MVSLVSSLAEEINHTKLVLNTLIMQQQQNPIRHSNSNVKDDLIPVSDEEDADDDDVDDDDNEDDDEDEDEDENEDEDEKNNEDEDDKDNGGLREIKSILFDKTMHHDNIKLNEIDLNEQDNDESMLFSQGAPISLNQIMASIFQNAHMVPFRHQQNEVEQNDVEEDVEQLEEFVQDFVEVEQNEVEQNEVEQNEVDKLVDKPVDKLVEFQDIKSIDLSSINISNESSEPSEKVVKKVKKVKEEKEDKEDKEDKEETDFKKMSIQKLRTVVLEKQLSSDPSKLKKQELLKLLEG
jgi:hypothetical protein